MKYLYSICILLCLWIPIYSDIPEDMGSLCWTAWKNNPTIEISPSSLNLFYSKRLVSSWISSYKKGLNCELTIIPPYGYGLVVSLRMLDFRPNCKDNLTLTYQDPYDKSFMFCNVFNKRNKLVDKEEKQSFYSNGNFKLTFKTAASSNYIFDSKTVDGYDGFELIYTVASRDKACKSNQFLCKNGRCIPDDLTCDGHNHCGDRSDQQNCNKLSIGKIVGIVFGVAFLIIAAICGIYLILRKKKSSTTSTVIYPPPNPQYPYPSTGAQHPPPNPQYPYPNTGAQYPPPYQPPTAQQNYPYR